MTSIRETGLAAAIVAMSGVVWGFYWLPVRALSDMGLAGAWGTVAITVAAVIILSPIAFQKRRELASCDRVALISVAIGGAAFALYSIGFIYGRVAIIILLYFLTPVWSTLIAKYLLGWQTSRLRALAIFVGLAGLSVMLGADGELPVPRGVGEWMALIAGILWSVGTTGIKQRANLTPTLATFVFAIGAALTSLALAPVLSPAPDIWATQNAWSVFALAFLTGGVWWGLFITGLMWASQRLEPARVGILLMTEVLVGAISAAVLASETLSTLELAGGALVLCAAVLELWPSPTHKPQNKDPLQR